MTPSFAVCICTRNRPEEVAEAIQSVLTSRHPVREIIVSDDSTDDRTRALLASGVPSAARGSPLGSCSGQVQRPHDLELGREGGQATSVATNLMRPFSPLDQVAEDNTEAPTPHRAGITYTAGPRTGLGANRNHALAQITASHVLFMDDDARLDPDFFTHMATALRDQTDAGRLIVTGTEINHGERVFPHKQSFLGFQAVDYAPDDILYSIVINATVFPMALFTRVKFDPSLIYGYEELDVTARAVFRHGFAVRLAPAAANLHFPSAVNRDFYAPFTEASRIYVTFKKYYFLERRRGKAVLFLLAAGPHNLAHNLRHRGGAGLAACRTTLGTALTYIHRCLRAEFAYV